MVHDLNLLMSTQGDANQSLDSFQHMHLHFILKKPISIIARYGKHKSNK
jgi:hypothetical protein